MSFSDDPRRQGPSDRGTGAGAPPAWGDPNSPQRTSAAPLPVDDGRSRLVVKVAAAVTFVVVVGLVIAVSVKVAVRDRTPSSARSRAGDAGSVVRGIGPAPGTDLSLYLENRRQALRVASGERVAVVSLARYMSESEARAVAGSNPVRALMAAIPGGSPATVTTDLGTWLDGEQSAIRSERDEIQKLIPTVTGDPEFKAFYEQEVKRLSDALDTVKADSALVFGVVVSGPADALRVIGSQPGVRLVDVAPPEAPTPGADYRGIRPEEAITANDPPTRPL